MNRDEIEIEGLSVDCVIGFAQWERMVKQTIVLDMRLAVDVRKAALADEPRPDLFNTKSLSKRLQSYIAGTEFHLIETLAERVAELILEEFPVHQVRLKLSKPGALRGTRNVAVRITRKPGDFPLQP